MKTNYSNTAKQLQLLICYKISLCTRAVGKILQQTQFVCPKLNTLSDKDDECKGGLSAGVILFVFIPIFVENVYTVHDCKEYKNA